MRACAVYTQRICMCVAAVIPPRVLHFSAIHYVCIPVRHSACLERIGIQMVILLAMIFRNSVYRIELPEYLLLRICSQSQR